MQQYLQILRYGTFFEHPRGMLVKVDDHVIDMVCPFDEDTNQYADYFEVNLIVNALPHDVQTGSFRADRYPAVYLGQLPTDQIKFDPTRGLSLQSPHLQAMVQDHRGEAS